MNKQVNLILIEGDKLSQGSYAMDETGEVLVVTEPLMNDNTIKLTPVTPYLIDNEPIIQNRYYIDFTKKPQLKFNTEIDHVIKKGKFDTNQKRVYALPEQIGWFYNVNENQIYPFSATHLNMIIKNHMSCQIREINNECNGATCANCDCYEFSDANFKPHLIDNKFVIVV
jgi:hypothetical protein